MKKFILCFLTAFLLLQGCSSGNKNELSAGNVTLTLGAYTVPKDVYQKEIIPAFQKMWKEKTGQSVKFEESYIASGAQSRAISSGFEADIAALSLEQDVNRLQKEGLITHDWKNRINNGFVTRSIVVIAYRTGNPKNITGWKDLTREDVDVLYPSPKTSGGAMWDVNAIYGAGLKASEVETGNPDPSQARQLLKGIQRRVKTMDKSGRTSVTTFENGIGDVLLTYENEALLRQKTGRDFPFLIPEATILIENPIAIVDLNVDKHGNREAASAFVDFVLTREAQRSFARYGFRPVNEEIAEEFTKNFPLPRLLFDISYLGGWERVYVEIYGEDGVWTQIVRELADEK
ncbi:MAG: sulfate ABC transporter substrate-binding protein [Candidatus Aminicenantes bacterium]|nr:sulfate ABC transporter substrate-binding protein [Candidatus Aminicenantes bacterium]